MYSYQQHGQHQEYYEMQQQQHQQQQQQQRHLSQGGYHPSQSLNASSFFNSAPNPGPNLPEPSQGYQRHASRVPTHTAAGNESLSTMTNRTMDCRALHPGATHVENNATRMNYSIPSTIQVSNTARNISEGTVGTYASANASQFFSQTISTVNEDGSQVSHSSRQHQEYDSPALNTAVNLFSKTASALFHTTAAAVNAAETVGERMGTLRSDFVKIAAPMPQPDGVSFSRNGTNNVTNAKSFFGGNIAGDGDRGNGGVPFANPSPVRTVSSAAEMFQQSSADTAASGMSERHQMETINLFGTVPPSSVRVPSPMSYVRDSSPASSVRDLSPIPDNRNNPVTSNVSASSFFAPSRDNSLSNRSVNTPVRTASEIFGRSATPVRKHDSSPSMPLISGIFDQNGARSKDSSRALQHGEKLSDNNDVNRQSDVDKKYVASETPKEKLATLTPAKGDITQSLRQIANFPRPPPSRMEPSPALSTISQFPKPPVLPTKSSSTPNRSVPKEEKSNSPQKPSGTVITPKSTPIVSKPLPTFPKPRLPSPIPRRPKAAPISEQGKFSLPLPEKKALPLPEPKRKPNDTEMVLEKKDITTVGKGYGKSNASVGSGSVRSVKSAREGLFRVPPPLQITASPLAKRSGGGMPSPLPSPISVSKKTSGYESSPDKQTVDSSICKSPISRAVDGKVQIAEQKVQSILPPLPDGWIELTTPDTGIKYYLNPSTRETSWERPVTKHESSNYLQSPLASKDKNKMNIDSNRNIATNDVRISRNSHKGIVKNVAEKFVVQTLHDVDKDSKCVTLENENMEHFAKGLDTEAENRVIVSKSISPVRDNQVNQSVNQHFDSAVARDSVNNESPGRSSGVNEKRNSTPFQRPDVSSGTDVTIRKNINVHYSPVTTSDHFVSTSGHVDEHINYDKKIIDESHELHSEIVHARHLADGWIEMFDESSGQPYYFHEIENITQWDRPTAYCGYDGIVQQIHDVATVYNTDATDLPGISKGIGTEFLPEGWVEMIDESSGKPYYVNEIDNITQWEKPKALLDEKKEAELNFDTHALPVSKDIALISKDSELTTDDVSAESRGNHAVKIAENAAVTNLAESKDESKGKSSCDLGDFKETETTLQEPKTEQYCFKDIASGEVANIRDVKDNRAEGTDERGEIQADKINRYGSLQEGWVEMIDESSGLPYYFNEKDNVTQWERPETDIDNDGTNDHACFSTTEIPSDGDVLVSTDDTEQKVEDVADIVEADGQVTDEGVSADALPDGWVEMTDESSGLPYYYNEVDNVTQWERPEVSSGNENIATEDKEEYEQTPVTDTPQLVTEEVADVDATDRSNVVEDVTVMPLPEGWVEMIDESSGLPYYFNEKDNVTQWERPETDVDNDGTNDHACFSTTEIPSEGDVLVSTDDTEQKVEGVADIVEADGQVTDEGVSADALPDGWVEMIDESSGLPYYYNEVDNVTQWDRPTISSIRNAILPPVKNSHDSSIPLAQRRRLSDIDDVNLPAGWVELEEPTSGRIYYYNEFENTTQWERPASRHVTNHVEQTITSFRSRPAHAIAAFGFGGRLCVMKPQLADNLGYATSHPKANLRKGPVEIHRLADLVISDHIPLGGGIVSLEKPFIYCSEHEVMEYLQTKCGLSSSDDELLWNLVLVAARWKGCLRSVDGISNLNGPEAAVVDLLLSREPSKPSTSLLSPVHGSSSVIDSSFVAEVQRLLIRGDRKEAVKCALSGGNYALALLIASLCGPKTYYTTARYFIEKTLIPGTPLHTATTLFANQIQSTEESDDQATDLWSDCPRGLEASWHYHLATILSNQGRGWKRIVTALGDHLLLTGNIYAAHFCYLICGRPIMPLSDPSSRIVLVGCDHKHQLNASLATKESWEAYLRTEALEWAKRKGNPNAVITALQPFKLKYAMLLADYGFESIAKMYVDSLRKCTGISASPNQTKGNSASHCKIYPQDFVESLNIFEDRLSVSLGLQSFNAGSNQSYKFVLSNVLSKIITKSDKTGDKPVYTDARFDDEANDVSNDDANMTFVSASSNIFDTATTPATTVKSSYPKHQPLSMENKRPNTALMSTVKEFCGESSYDQVQPKPVNISMRSPVKIEAERSSRTAAPPMPNLNDDDAVQTLYSKPVGNVEHGSTKQQAVKQVIEEAPRSNPVNLTRSAASTPVDRKTKKDAPSSGSSWSVRGWLTRKLNPDATEADVGDAMEAYYDEKLKRWIFPGDDPNEVAKPLAPPPTTPVVKHETGSVSTPILNRDDPLSMMMAPPSRSTPKADPLSNLLAPPSRSTPSNMLKGPPTVPRSTISQMNNKQSPHGTTVGQIPPQFVIFQPSKKDEK